MGLASLKLKVPEMMPFTKSSRVMVISPVRYVSEGASRNSLRGEPDYGP